MGHAAGLGLSINMNGLDNCKLLLVSRETRHKNIVLRLIFAHLCPIEHLICHHIGFHHRDVVAKQCTKFAILALPATPTALRPGCWAFTCHCAIEGTNKMQFCAATTKGSGGEEMLCASRSNITGHVKREQKKICYVISCRVFGRGCVHVRVHHESLLHLLKPQRPAELKRCSG